MNRIFASVFCLLVATACGSSRELKDDGAGGGAGETSTGGNGGTGGEGTGGGGTGGTGGGGTGGGSTTCDPECDGDTPVCVAGQCVECAPNSARCSDATTPETCVNGQWEEAEECAGEAPLCIAGSCGAIALSGGLVSQRATSASGRIRMLDHGFEAVSTMCREVDNETMCVTGGIRP